MNFSRSNEEKKRSHSKKGQEAIDILHKLSQIQTTQMIKDLW